MSTVIALHNSVPAERSVGGGGSVEGKSLGRDQGLRDQGFRVRASPPHDWGSRFKGKNVLVSGDV